jgi:hypothetical protein
MPKKQLEIPGTEVDSIPEIEEAAELYVKARDRRMRLTEQEIAAKVNLLQVCVANEDKLSPNQDGDKCYTYEDEMVILKRGKANVKVKLLREKDESDDED